MSHPHHTQRPTSCPRCPLAAWGSYAVLLGVTLTIGSRSVSAEWQESRAEGVFQLRAEFNLGESTGTALLRQMQILESEVQDLLKLQAGTGEIEVNLFRSQGSYRDYVSQRVPEGASRPALYVQGTDRGRVYVYRSWGYEKNLRHECTHAVLHNTLPYIPMWLDEGIAEYFEVPSAERESKNPHLSGTKRAILFGWEPDLRRLESLSSLQDMDGADYRESWAWVHYLMHGPVEVRQVLSDYLHDIQDGEVAGSLGDRLFRVAPDAESRLVSHVKHWR